jgi:transcriptional antiterminator RfaH
MMQDARWFVVQTQSHCETKAAHHLSRQGFETYLPRYLKRRRHARRVESVAAPLFPRYLFVAIDIGAQRWRAIQSTVGVARLVCHGDQPAPLRGDVVDEMRRRENDAGFVQIDRRPLFAPGAKVRILAGAFAEAFGLYEGVSDRDRVVILLDLLGRKVRVRLDTDFVTAA